MPTKRSRCSATPHPSKRRPSAHSARPPTTRSCTPTVRCCPPARAERVSHAFAYRHPMWLVDLDAIPVLPKGVRWLGSFGARDHVGDPALGMRANVDALLERNGIDAVDGRVLMLANARSFGHAF